jgi:hypothetical protein
MTTQKNQAARRQETKQEKRGRLVDPALDSAEEQRAVQASNPTLQANMTAARKQEFDNRKSELQGDITGLQRMKDRAARGYSAASRAGYDRIYQRLTRLAQVLADQFGHEVSIPEYDPPVEGANVKMRTVAPRSAAERASEGAYHETKGMGPSGRGGPAPGYPGTDADDAWLNVQGATK